MSSAARLVPHRLIRAVARRVIHQRRPKKPVRRVAGSAVEIAFPERAGVGRSDRPDELGAGVSEHLKPFKVGAVAAGIAAWFPLRASHARRALGHCPTLESGRG